MHVREHLEIVFNGDYHGIYRDIPIEYPGPHGSNYKLFLKVTGVTDGHGPQAEIRLQRAERLPPSEDLHSRRVDTTRTVEIDYTVSNAVRWFDDHDELYWNVTGNDWPVPIDSAAANDRVPARIAAGNLRAQAFTGVYGSQTQDAHGRGERQHGAGRRPTIRSQMREGLTADVYISKGVLNEPSKLTYAMWFLRSNTDCAAAAVGVRGDVLLLVDQGPRSQGRHFGRAHVRAAAGHDSGRGRHADRRHGSSARHHFDAGRPGGQGLSQDRGDGVEDVSVFASRLHLPLAARIRGHIGVRWKRTSGVMLNHMFPADGDRRFSCRICATSFMWRFRPSRKTSWLS